MINLAFWFDAPYAYSGGLNYIANLLYALSTVNSGEVRPYLFFATDVPESVLARFREHAIIVRTKMLQRYTLQWLVHKLLYRFFNSAWFINHFLKKHNINVISHVWFPYYGRRGIKVIAWIPDFQYLHLPEMFPGLDVKKESDLNRKIATCADAVFVSSKSALNDLLSITRGVSLPQVRVLPFVSQPFIAPQNRLPELPSLEIKYSFAGKFFLLPNQFWAHKNHQIVIEALTLAKREGVLLRVLMTGNTVDYRLSGSPYIESLYELIERNDIRDCAIILGMIDYSDLLALMRNCVAVINPSKFEGWSSTVEEAKSMGKNIILSKIPVHIEQAPEFGAYFDCDDAVYLKDLMINSWNHHSPLRDAERYRVAQNNIVKRTREFGSDYLELLKKVLVCDERAS